MDFITIPGFEDLTKQQMFDMSAAHLLSTRVRSAYNKRCCYAGSGCAAAPFIREEKRSKADTVGSWLKLAGAYGEDQSYVPTHEHSFVEELQRAHDHAANDFIPSWKMRMYMLADRYGLSTALLDQDQGA